VIRSPTINKRVQFDFEIEFSNGGGLAGRSFRLDIDGDDIDDDTLADLLVRDLRLLMVGAVRIRNKIILSEAHKRGAIAVAAACRGKPDHASSTASTLPSDAATMATRPTLIALPSG